MEGGGAPLAGRRPLDSRRCRHVDGSTVLLIGGASGLRIFDLASEKMIAQVPDAQTGKYAAGDLGYPKFDTNGREVLFGRKGGQHRWSIATGAVSSVATQPAEDHVVEATSRDGRRAFCTRIGALQRQCFRQRYFGRC
jgi:hypothetical protein